MAPSTLVVSGWFPEETFLVFLELSEASLMSSTFPSLVRLFSRSLLPHLSLVPPSRIPPSLVSPSSRSLSLSYLPIPHFLTSTPSLDILPTACSYDAPDYIPAMRKNISEIIIVTRGLCGSTCAFVANHAAIFSHIKTVVVGGIHGMPMQYTSFPGFQVLDSPFIRQEVSSYGIDPSLVPPALPNDARYRMCVRQIYPTRYETIPTEFTFMHADYHFSDTLETVLYPELSWLQVVNLFD